MPRLALPTLALIPFQVKGRIRISCLISMGFDGFLEGGALDDVFGIPTNSVTKPISNLERDEWEVTKLSGGLVNVVVRVTPRCGGGELGRNPRSAIIKHVPPFVAGMGEDAPFGTFRQVRNVLHFPSRHRYQRAGNGSSFRPSPTSKC